MEHKEELVTGQVDEDIFADIPLDIPEAPVQHESKGEDIVVPITPVEATQVQEKVITPPGEHIANHEETPDVLTREPAPEKDERKLRETADKLFSFVEKYPQTHLAVGGSREENGKRLLRANASGSVTLSSSDDTTGLVTVEFADTHRMKKRVLENTHKFTLADIGDNAFVLASHGAIENVDEYEEDNEEDERKCAVVYFCNAAKDATWSVELGEGESVLDVCISSRMVFVLTGDNCVRGFDFGKNEVFQVSIEAPVVAMCAFEHFLGLAYNTGLPAQGMQAMKVRVYNADEMRVDFDVPIALSPYKKMQWLGFSDEGALYCQDTSDCVRMLTAHHLWIPVFHNSKPRKFWMLGIIDRDLVGYNLAEGEPNPNPSFRYQPVSVKRKIDVLSDRNSDRQASLMLRRVDHANATRTLHEFSFMKQTETSNPLRQIFKGRIKGPQELQEDMNELEADKVELIRKLLVEGNTDAAIHASLQLRSLAHFQVVLGLLDSLKDKKTREELTKLANEFGFFDRVSTNVVHESVSNGTKPSMPVLSEERRAELNKFLEDNKPTESRMHSFNDLKTLSRKETDAPTHDQRVEQTKTHTTRMPVPPTHGSSIMEEFGHKHRKLRP